MCAISDMDGDGVQEVLWGERCIELGEGRELFCADRDTWRGHSDVATPVLDRATGRLARALTGTIATLDPEALVIGSSSKAFSTLVQPLLQRHLYTELIGFDAREAEIVIAEPTRATTLTGVAGMVVERVFASGGEC